MSKPIISLSKLVLLLSSLMLGLQQRILADEASDVKAVMELFEQKCSSCHGQSELVTDLRILERDTLLAGTTKGGKKWLTPNKPEESAIFVQIDKGLMPEGEDRLAEEQVALVKRWITNGAQFDVAKGRKFISEADILSEILDYVNDSRIQEVPFLRFFSIAHLHNNPKVRKDVLQQTRAALSKALNSLSREPDIVIPKAIDEDETIYVINMKDFGWENDMMNLWVEIKKLYPYGTQPTTQPAADYYDKIKRVYGNLFFPDMCYLRADWFVREATRPPLYHDFLDLPLT
ncbi:MAG: hypothetical protein KDA84_14510, partial [Planctomycetaceae bacterium]|nr:hypothetical protein [Planctomycetaceae bacterium]